MINIFSKKKISKNHILYNKTKELIKDKKYQEALNILLTIDINKLSKYNKAVILDLLGICYFRLEDYEKCLDTSFTHINIVEDKEVYSRIGFCYSFLGNYRKAIEYLSIQNKYKDSIRKFIEVVNNLDKINKTKDLIEKENIEEAKELFNSIVINCSITQPDYNNIYEIENKLVDIFDRDSIQKLYNSFQ